MAPDENGSDDDQIYLTEDRRGYTMHGKVMLLVVVLLFALFLFSLLFCLYLRRLARLRRDRDDDDCSSQAAEHTADGFKGRQPGRTPASHDGEQ